MLFKNLYSDVIILFSFSFLNFESIIDLFFQENEFFEWVLIDQKGIESLPQTLIF